MERPPDFTWFFRLLRDALLVWAAIGLCFWAVSKLL